MQVVKKVEIICSLRESEVLEKILNALDISYDYDVKSGAFNITISEEEQL